MIILVLYERYKEYYRYQGLKIIRVDEDSNILVGTKDSIGIDLLVGDDTIIPPFETVKVVHNLKTKMPKNISGIILPRSSTNLAGLLNIKSGVIDPDYRGLIATIVENNTDQIITLKKGDRVSQLLFTICVAPSNIKTEYNINNLLCYMFSEFSSFLAIFGIKYNTTSVSDSATKIRGSSGFGSTNT